MVCLNGILTRWIICCKLWNRKIHGFIHFVPLKTQGFIREPVSGYKWRNVTFWKNCLEGVVCCRWFIPFAPFFQGKSLGALKKWMQWNGSRLKSQFPGIVSDILLEPGGAVWGNQLPRTQPPIVVPCQPGIWQEASKEEEGYVATMWFFSRACPATITFPYWRLLLFPSGEGCPQGRGGS